MVASTKLVRLVEEVRVWKRVVEILGHTAIQPHRAVKESQKPSKQWLTMKRVRAIAMRNDDK